MNGNPALNPPCIFVTLPNFIFNYCQLISPLKGDFICPVNIVNTVS